MDENTIRRVQPHNEKAEQGIVGTMLVNRDAISDLVDMLEKRSDCRSIRWICKKYAASKEAWYGSNLKEPE